MFARYRDQSLARQIVQISCVLLLVIFSVLTVLVTVLSERTALRQTEQSLADQAQAMKLQLDAYFENVKDRGDRSNNLFRKYLPGELSRGNSVIRTGEIELPELRSGTQVLNANHALLETFKAMTGDEAAILWVGNGKVVRVATLLKKDGKPMDGTQIAADDPVAVALLQGKDYSGLTVRNGEYYFSSVKAVRPEGEKQFVALSVRVSLQAELAQLRSMFGAMHTGKTGYAYILRSTGKPETVAEFVLHPTLQNKTVDAANSPALRDAVLKIVAAKEGVMRYDFPDANGSSQERIVALATSPGWGWIIGTGSWLDEYLEEAHQLRNWMIGLGILAAAMAGALIFILVRSRLRPLSQAVEVAKAISDGRLDSDIQVTRHDEIGTLMTAMQQMQNDLRSIITEVQTVVEAAANGDFTRQTDLSAKQGFGLDISKSLNSLNSSLLAQIGGNPAEAAQVASRIAAGDLGGALNVRPGDTQSVLAAMASMRDSLAMVIADVQAMVNSAVAGDFSQKIDGSTKQGYSRTLSELLNQLSDVTEGGLKNAIRVAQAIAEGDLTQKIDQEYPGLFGDLRDATNATVDGLQEMIGRIQEAADAINVAAQEIAQGNQDLSGRTEEQASSLEETASSMEQLNTTVRQNTENAFQANRLASASNEIATRSGEMVGRIVDTMSDIQTSSRKIADIIGVIDGISFQTNILALNAAVEAARAGEQGRGFAVVATEVRNLAQRSAVAAKEIRGLIAESVTKVDGGVTLVRDAGEIMANTVSSSERVSSLLAGIAEASKEQSDGIDQVTNAVGQMDEVTQQNAALVEQAAAAAKALEDQARVLADTLSRFKLSADQKMGRIRRAASAKRPSVNGPAPSATKLLSKPPEMRPIRSNALVDEWTEF